MPTRRLITIPGYLVAWATWLAAAPAWLLLALAVDVARRRRFVALRGGAMLAAYLSLEVVGILAGGALWLSRPLLSIDEPRWVDLHFRLEAWWGTTLFQLVVWLFGLRIETTGEADLACGPYLLLVRHTSMADTLVASALASRPHGLRLRYVLKKPLLLDPCLDIVGQRLPNVFADRESDDPAREAERVGALGRDLGPRDGVLIYPEGTRFSEHKRARVLEQLRERGDADAIAYAESLNGVLPPRLGGTLALLEGAPDADVVVCVHTGFEGAGSFRRIWRGELVGRTARVNFRRIPRREVPREREARAAWLRALWREVAAEVERLREAG